MSQKRRTELLKIILSLLLMIASFFIKSDKEIYINTLYILAYLIMGYKVILKAIRNILKGKIFDENFLMTIATLGAVSIGELKEAVAVMLFYQIGELFQNYAVDKSRNSVTALMDIRPDYANVCRQNEIKRVDPDEVNIGEIILVKPGEKIPLDGTVVEGTSLINKSALTGESIPEKVSIKDEVLSGCINNEGILKIKVNKNFQESTVNKILDLIENASNRKSKSENFISKFAKVYTPIVVIIAILLAVIPPLIIKDALFKNWLYKSLSFLVVSCPCALVISIPLSFFGGLGAASKRGVLIKGSNYLEALSNTEIVVYDKTGTLTKGEFKVQKIEAINGKKEDLLKYATYAEYYSNHPIALSLKQSYNKKIQENLITKTKEISGKGISAVVDNKNILVGQEKLMEEHNIQYQKSKEIGTILYVAINKIFAGTIVIADKIKEDSYKAIKLLKKNNIKKIVMLTGDKDPISSHVAKELNIEEYHAELLPQDKVFFIEKLMDEKSANGKLIFIGDGINDAPVLALSDIGCSMGNMGSDAAIESADVVIMTDEPSKIIDAIHISKKTMKVVKENIILTIFIKLLVLILSVLGLASMWSAIFADVGVSILAILNALRILYIKMKD